MMNDRHDEVDREAAEAWVRFQAMLADRLAALGEGGVLVVDAMVGDDDEPGAAPYVQAVGWGEDLLRGEVASNHVLMAPRELGPEQEQALAELGYLAPTYGPDDEADLGSLNFHVDVTRSEADRLAVMSVRALRDVFGVAHPALLGGDIVDDRPAPEEAAAWERIDEPVAAYPHGGHEQLVELVDQALTSYFGHAPIHDDDGDIPVDLGSTALFVRVHESVPVVELFSCLATDVEDLERAAFEINVLNRDVRFVKFRLVGDNVLADLQLPAWPFAPEHLRAMLALMTESIERVTPDLLERVNGHQLVEEDGDDVADRRQDSDAADSDGAEDRSTASDAAEILAELNAESPGSVSAELAASICANDPGVILDLIRNEEHQLHSWRTARDECLTVPDTDVEGCDHEIAYSKHTLSLLRRALRVVMEQRAAGQEGGPAGVAQPVVRRQPRRRPPRPRRVPDPTIEEVDPEIWT